MSKTDMNQFLYNLDEETNSLMVEPLLVLLMNNEFEESMYKSSQLKLS